MALLEILFDRFPDRLEMASAYLQKAECLVSLGRIEESIDFFKKSIDFERHFPNVSTQAPLEYGLVVVERKLSNEYTSVLDILEEFEEDVSTFPVDRFYVAGIRAIIHSEIGNLTLARTFAKQALVEAAKEHSGFRNHPKLGLVGTRDVELLNILEQIATYDGTK